MQSAVETFLQIALKLLIWLIFAILLTVIPVRVQRIAIRYWLFPTLTVILIVVNSLIYIGLMALSILKDWRIYDEVLLRRGAVPYEILHAVDLPPPNGLGVPGVYLNILTSMFLHVGLFHLLGNMQFLWLFGPDLETGLNLRFDRRNRPVNRSWTFLFFYLLCGVGAVLVYALVFRNSPDVLIGASGAISGLLGAFLLKFWRDYRKVDILVLYWIPRQVSVNLYLLYWIALQVALGLYYGGTSRVAYVAHIGGFATGLVTVPLFRWTDVKTGKFR